MRSEKRGDSFYCKVVIKKQITVVSSNGFYYFFLCQHDSPVGTTAGETMGTHSYSFIYNLMTPQKQSCNDPTGVNPALDKPARWMCQIGSFVNEHIAQKWRGNEEQTEKDVLCSREWSKPLNTFIKKKKSSQNLMVEEFFRSFRLIPRRILQAMYALHYRGNRFFSLGTHGNSEIFCLRPNPPAPSIYVFSILFLPDILRVLNTSTVLNF